MSAAGSSKVIMLYTSIVIAEFEYFTYTNVKLIDLNNNSSNNNNDNECGLANLSSKK